MPLIWTELPTEGLNIKELLNLLIIGQKILKEELEIIELEKQNFKQSKNLSDLKLDADTNIKQQFNYNSELFSAESQKTLGNFY